MKYDKKETCGIYTKANLTKTLGKALLEDILTTIKPGDTIRVGKTTILIGTKTYKNLMKDHEKSKLL